MFCENCGKQSVNSSGICEACGHSHAALSETAAASSPTSETQYNQYGASAPAYPGYTVQEPQPKPKKVFLKVVVALIVVALLGVGAYAGVQLMKSPKQSYMEIESKNIDQVKDQVKNAFKYSLDKLEKQSKDTYEAKTEISMGADIKNIPGADSAQLGIISELLNSFKISATTKSDPKKKQSVNDFDVSLKDKSLVKGTIVTDDQKVAISVPDLYEKYILADLGDMASLKKTFGMGEGDNFPKKLLSSDDIMGAFKVNEKDLDQIIMKYGKVYFDSIDEKNLTLEKSVEFDAGSGKVNCKKFTVKFDEATFRKMLLNFYDAMAEDDALLNVTYGNILNLYKLYYESGYITKEAFEKLDSIDVIKKKIKDAKTDFKADVDKMKLPGAVTMSVFVDGSRIIGRSIDIPTEEVTVNVSCKEWDKDKTKMEVLEIVATSKVDSSKLNLKFTSESQLNEKDYTGTANVKIDLNVTSSEGQNISGSGELALSNEEKGKSNISEFKMKFAANQPDSTEKLASIDLNTKTETTFGVDVKMPDLSNALNLNKASDAELQQFGQDMQAAMQKFIMENMQLFQSIMAPSGGF
ncbi:MAG: hypothetical protein N2645_07790 [Clostridia bacterium]|nr:hypothetical protein [Clostridia bacterium]